MTRLAGMPRGPFRWWRRRARGRTDRHLRTGPVSGLSSKALADLGSASSQGNSQAVAGALRPVVVGGGRLQLDAGEILVDGRIDPKAGADRGVLMLALVPRAIAASSTSVAWKR